MGTFARAVLHYIRMWDYAAGQRPDYFIANSRFISARIKRCYGRTASVIYPPVDVDRFTPGSHKDDFYFTASRMVPYKKMSLIVKAFSKLPDRKLIVIGDGPERSRIQTGAGPNVEFLGYQPDDVLKDHLRRARAFVFAAQEDFGILPVEAQACGTPVIALGYAGTKETVVDGETGVLFKEQTVESLIGGVKKFEDIEHAFVTDRIRSHAEKFNSTRFRGEFESFLSRAAEEFKLQRNLSS